MVEVLHSLTTLCVLPLICCTDWIENRGLWYYISENENVDYRESSERCTSMNAHLAVITNDDQNTFITFSKNDSLTRWIGMSNNRTRYHESSCDNKAWFWNSDWTCTNDFRPAGVSTHSPSSCTGITTKSGIWNAADCTDRFGYICQWECNKYYFEINEYTGIYEFYSYFNGYARYRKVGTNNTVRIYKSAENIWILNDDDDNNLVQRAKFDTESYVPYGNKLYWKKISGAPLISSTWCIEDLTLCMCITPTADEIQNCNLIMLNDAIPEYSNGRVFLKHHELSRSCICMPTRQQCGDRCGYIFPYPTLATITLNNGENVTFSNTCSEQAMTKTTGITNDVISISNKHSESSIQTKPDIAWTTVDKMAESEMSNADMNSHTDAPDLFHNNQANDFTTIIASTVSVIIVMIIAVVVIVIVVRKKRNINKGTKSHFKSGDNPNSQFNNANSNVYMECGDPIPVHAQEPTYSEPTVETNFHNESKTEDHYTCVDDIDKQYSVSNTDIIYSKEKPICGYLAPDYGILMDDLTKQNKQNSKLPTHEQPVYTEVKKNYFRKQAAQQDNVRGEDSNAREYGSPGSQNSGQNVDTKDSNDSEYYNVESKCNGDDDLELFENTIYNQM